MKRNHQRTVGRIAAHALERQRSGFLPADPILSRFQGRTDRRDDCVRHVRMCVNCKTAEIERRNIFCQLGIMRFGNDRAAKTEGFEFSQHGFIERQDAHAVPGGGIDPTAHRLVDDHVNFAARNGAESVFVLRQTLIVAHLAAPKGDVIQ